MSGITTAKGMKAWQAEAPCCTTRPYDHVHPPKDIVAEAEADIAQTYEELAQYNVPAPKVAVCSTCQATEDQVCVTAGGNAVVGGHAARFVTETEEEE